MLSRIAWRCLALTFLTLGLLGALLPGLPTTVFLLLAAWASGRGWPALNRWLLNHPRYGASIVNWQRHQILPRRAKYLATVMMTFSMLMIGLSTMSFWIKAGLIALLVVILSWLLTRREARSSC